MRVTSWATSGFQVVRPSRSCIQAPKKYHSNVFIQLTFPAPFPCCPALPVRIVAPAQAAGDAIANGCAAEALAESVWDETMDVNLKGVWLSCRAEGRAMIAHAQGGAIVNIASMSGSLVNRGLLQAHYNASKAGVIHLSKSLAMEWIKHGVRVNSISPGYTATPMALRADMEAQRAVFEEQVPMERMASPGEMVGPAVFLLSKAASYVTGHDLVVDGGASVW